MKDGMKLDAELDPNINPCRPDLAAAHLRDLVAAERYVEGSRRQAVRGIVPLRGRPDETAPQTSELIYGETFVVYEEKDGWAWGQCEADGYVGYARAGGLSAEVIEPTHRISALRCFVFPEPSVKTAPLKALSMGARVAVTDRRDRYLRIAPEGWVHETAVEPVGSVTPDYLATARRFLGVPYLWGGRSSLGIDCSGLVQVSLGAAGIRVQRDTYLQRDTLGDSVPLDGRPLERGDIVFFPGHVGMMLDDRTLLHSTAYWMTVCEEPVADVAARTLESEGAGIVAVRRPTRG